MIRSSLEELWDWVGSGEKIWWRLSMTIAIRLRILSWAPTSSIFSSRKASHGPNQSHSAMIGALGSTEFSNASLCQKAQASWHKTCLSYQSWSVRSINCLGRTRSIELSTNLIESNAQLVTTKKVKRQRGRHGFIKMRCKENPTLAPYSWSARETRSSSRSRSQIWTVSSSGSNGSP